MNKMNRKHLYVHFLKIIGHEPCFYKNIDIYLPHVHIYIKNEHVIK